MPDSFKRNFVMVVVVLSAVLLLAALCSPNYIKVKDRARNMALDSGVDKKTSNMALTSGEDYIGDRGASGSEAYAYKQSAPAGTRAPQAPAGQQQPDKQDAQALRGRDFSALPDVRRWLVPAVYAAEHNQDDRYIVRSGLLELRVESVDDTAQKIADTAAQCGGGITDSSIRKSESGYRSGTVTVRVPADRFSEAWKALRQVGERMSEQITSADVSGEYISAVSRMNTLLVEQTTLQKMLDEALAVQRARGLGEGYNILLDTQKRLSEVTAQIREIEDRVAALADQVTRSTITINLSENPQNPVVTPKDEKFNWGIGATFNQSVRDLMETLRGIANFLIHFLITAWVWLIPLLLLCWLAWRYYRRVLATAAPGPAPAGGDGTAQ